MSDLATIQIERDPTIPAPELEGQASAKPGAAWRFSYRPWGSAEAWRYAEAGDLDLDGILRRAGYRRLAGAAPAPAFSGTADGE